MRKFFNKIGPLLGRNPVEGPDAPAGQRQVELILLENVASGECPFWFGLFSPGSYKPKDLMQLDRVEDVFYQVNVHGLDEKVPTLVSIVNDNQRKTVYLVPRTNDTSFREYTVWLSDIARSIFDLGTDKIGFCLSSDFHNEMFEEIIRSLIVSTKVETVYLLTGNSNKSHILKEARSLKEDLKGTGCELTIFH
jgi:hypothetical protein